MRFSIFLLMAGVCMLLFGACNTCSRQQTLENVTIDLADLAIDSSYVIMAQKVFYALPTPVEMSMLIKNMGISYQPALLNDPVNAAKYMNHRQMALNFGVYVTDLTYAGIFEQTQTVLRYKQAIQKLTEGLGLQSAIDLNTLQLLEANVHNRDVVLQVISEMYASCTASLNENERYPLTLSMLLGGWVEAMYIASTMINENLASDESRMMQLVVDQKLTFDMIWKVMSDLQNVPDVADLMNDLSDLAKVFDKIGVHHTPSVVTVASDGKTDIASSTNSNATPETFAKIRDQIQILRQNFTKI